MIQIKIVALLMNNQQVKLFRQIKITHEKIKTGFIYTQPTSFTTVFQQDMTTGQQSIYTTNGNSTVILPLNPK